MKTSEIEQIKLKYQIVGADEKLNQAIDTALQVSPTDLSVLIEGESGVGKEVLPRIIHDHSPRRNKRYFAINCGSIPEGTIDSELFGHERGAFTGAVAEHDGYFAAADGGTLFLDEVGELPLSTQARLLRVLESGEYIRVGSNTPRKTNVRIVAATNVKMQRAIREGRFREDLYYRLCTISVKLPPLRERHSDVVRLFKKFALDTAAKYNIPVPIRLNEQAEQVVMSYKWPGNIRQLRNVVEQMSILCRDERIVTPEVLAQYGIVPNGSSTEMATVGLSEEPLHDYNKERTIIFALLNQLAQDVKALKEGTNLHTSDTPLLGGNLLGVPSVLTTPATTNGTGETVYAPVLDEAQVVNFRTEHPVFAPTRPSSNHFEPSYEVDDFDEFDEAEDLRLDKLERQAIEKALKRTHNRRKVAAEQLGISERTLYRKIKDYGLDD
ncbi:MAG: sigma-54 dependent transcriptional regulator [Bacteroidaceae bacterium]|nr:sigma-54 dependent transcriptional regulator [Bacteroidaceae bacterium]